ncbi:MAG: hypothetical protein K6T83_10190 [Alicyclobacillus sp.]|nr:hypothetical protein [Alicyclobacillus sp.]
MRVREHFLLGTETATISVTAKVDCNREFLFQHAAESILARYREEFGREAYLAFIQQLSEKAPSNVEWRLRPEDSCWNQVKSD